MFIGPEKEWVIEQWLRTSWLWEMVAPRSGSCPGFLTVEAEVSYQEYFVSSDALQFIRTFLTYTGLRIRVALLSQM